MPKPVKSPEYKSPMDQAEVITKIPSPSALHLPYYHSFGMSENYFVLAATPMTINVLTALTSNALRAPPVNYFDWDPHGKSTFYIINRR